MYTCMQCLTQGLPSQHFKVYVQYHDTYTANGATDQEALTYTLSHTDTCPNGHPITSTPIQVTKEDAEQMKGTKVIKKA